MLCSTQYQSIDPIFLLLKADSSNHYIENHVLSAKDEGAVFHAAIHCGEEKIYNVLASKQELLLLSHFLYRNRSCAHSMSYRTNPLVWETISCSLEKENFCDWFAKFKFCSLLVSKTCEQRKKIYSVPLLKFQTVSLFQINGITSKVNKILLTYAPPECLQMVWKTVFCGGVAWTSIAVRKIILA